MRSLHVQAEVKLPVLPLYDIEAAAGKFGTSQKEVEPQGWVEVPRHHIALTPDMYVTHVKGRSMEPTIPDGSLCAFRGNVSSDDASAHNIGVIGEFVFVVTANAKAAGETD